MEAQFLVFSLNLGEEESAGMMTANLKYFFIATLDNTKRTK